MVKIVIHIECQNEKCKHINVIFKNRLNFGVNKNGMGVSNGIKDKISMKPFFCMKCNNTILIIRATPSNLQLNKYKKKFLEELDEK